MNKVMLIGLWGLGLAFIGFCGAEPLQLEVEGESAILMNADTGQILFEKEAHKVLYPASTTKVATALYALKMKSNELHVEILADQEALATTTPESKVRSNYEIPAYWLEPNGSHIGIKKGEILTFKDLLSGMLISSGNDAANVIAQWVGGTIPQFMVGLNAYMKEIGCEDTVFYNPHGLHHPQHQTTAYDLAIMTQVGLKSPVFAEIVSQSRFMRPKTNKQKATTLLQTNRLLRQGKFYYSKAIGVKTGYHSKAKKTFVGAARSDGRTLIVVLLGYQDRERIFQDAIRLFDAAFNQPKVRRTFVKAGPQKFQQVLPRASHPLETYLAEDLALEYYPAEDLEAKCFLSWEPLTLPLVKNQKVGNLKLISGKGEVLQTLPLLAQGDVGFKWPHNWLAALRETVHHHLIWFKLGLVVLVMCVLGGIVFFLRGRTYRMM